MIDIICPEDSSQIAEVITDRIRQVAEVTGTSNRTVVIVLIVVFSLVTIALVVGIAICLGKAQ